MFLKSFEYSLVLNEKENQLNSVSHYATTKT